MINNMSKFLRIWLAGFLINAAFFPQVWKTWKSKSAADLFLAIFLVFSVGVLGWLDYGIMINQLPIIFWNVITLVLALAILIMKLKFG